MANKENAKGPTTLYLQAELVNDVKQIGKKKGFNSFSAYVTSVLSRERDKQAEIEALRN